MELKGRIAVVTGGAHGIGAGICRALHQEGARPLIIDRDYEAGEAIAAELDSESFVCDVGDEYRFAQLIGNIETVVGPIDLFVSNAGVAYGDGPTGAVSRVGILNPSVERWESCWQINVMAHVYAARVLVPRMIERGGGYLVNVASAAGLLSQIGDAAYATTKHAAVAFAESLRITHGDDGIGVSVVCPQAVATRMIGFDEETGELNLADIGGAELDGILSTDELADHVINGIKEERFMILPHPQVATYFQRKAEDYDRWVEGMRRFRKKLNEQTDD
jgi:NAD(P)-dependent dehydrogenase (short-subunit alcohol dehydrogenase family)